jgi:hypothetical protein
MADNPAFWDKAAEAVRSHRRAWVQEPRPAGVVPDKVPQPRGPET